MKKQLLIGVLSVLAASVMAADSAKDEVVNAAKKLAGSAYSWKQTSESPNSGSGNRQFQAGPTEGKIDKDGTAQISSTRGDNTFEYAVKGTKGAVKRDGAWVSTTEAADGGGEGRGGGRMFARLVENFKAPAVQAQELVSKAKSVTKSGDAYTAELSEEQVKSMMFFGGRGGNNAPEISGAKGTAKFWLKDGALSKYEYNVQGSMTIRDNERQVNRTTKIEIKDVGTTKLTLPEDAKKKLS